MSENQNNPRRIGRALLGNKRAFTEFTLGLTFSAYAGRAIAQTESPEIGLVTALMGAVGTVYIVLRGLLDQANRAPSAERHRRQDAIRQIEEQGFIEVDITNRSNPTGSTPENPVSTKPPAPGQRAPDGFHYH